MKPCSSESESAVSSRAWRTAARLTSLPRPWSSAWVRLTPRRVEALSAEPERTVSRSTPRVVPVAKRRLAPSVSRWASLVSSAVSAPCGLRVDEPESLPSTVVSKGASAESSPVRAISGAMRCTSRLRLLARLPTTASAMLSDSGAPAAARPPAPARTDGDNTQEQ